MGPAEHVDPFEVLGLARDATVAEIGEARLRVGVAEYLLQFRVQARCNRRRQTRRTEQTIPAVDFKTRIT